MKNLNFLKSNWFLITAAVGLILWYGNTNDRLSAVEANQTKLEQEHVELEESYSRDITQIKIDTAVVKENVLIIKQALAI